MTSHWDESLTIDFLYRSLSKQKYYSKLFCFNILRVLIEFHFNSLIQKFILVAFRTFQNKFLLMFGAVNCACFCVDCGVALAQIQSCQLSRFDCETHSLECQLTVSWFGPQWKILVENGTSNVWGNLMAHRCVAQVSGKASELMAESDLEIDRVSETLEP